MATLLVGPCVVWAETPFVSDKHQKLYTLSPVRADVILILTRNICSVERANMTCHDTMLQARRVADRNDDFQSVFNATEDEGWLVISFLPRSTKIFQKKYPIILILIGAPTNQVSSTGIP